MIETASTIAQVGVDRLPALYSSLTAALREAGISNGQLGEILSKYVSAECVLCGTRVSGEEITGITSAAEKTLAPDSKFGRLKRGSCVKIGCISCYYRVHLREHPSLDWTTIRERVSEEEAFKEANAAGRRLLIRVVLGVGIILILLLCRYVMYYGHLPLLQKPHQYTVDPATVAPEAPH